MSTNGTSTSGVLTDLGEALAAFVEVFSDSQTSNDVATHLRCAEVDALAELLRAAGDPSSAIRWLMAHSRGDHQEDDCDWHFDLTEADAAELMGVKPITEAG